MLSAPAGDGVQVAARTKGRDFMLQAEQVSKARRFVTFFSSIFTHFLLRSMVRRDITHLLASIKSGSTRDRQTDRVGPTEVQNVDRRGNKFCASVFLAASFLLDYTPFIGTIKVLGACVWLNMGREGGERRKMYVGSQGSSIITLFCNRLSIAISCGDVWKEEEKWGKLARFHRLENCQRRLMA